MSPDPKTVREIARKAVTTAVHDSVHMDQWISVVASSELGDCDVPTFVAYLTAIKRRLATVVVSWPDEQQPADVVTAEQQQDGACPCGCPTVGDMCDCGPGPCGCSPDPGCAFCDSPNDPPKTAQQPDGAVEALRMWLASRSGDDQLGQDVRAVLDNREAWRNLARSRGAERDALAARVAELVGERDDDLCVLAAFLLPNRRPIEEWLCILANHFEARTNALMRDADRFAAARFRVDRVPTATETEES